MRKKSPYGVALITGAASGLGRHLALELAVRGCAIAAVDRQAQGLQSLEADIRGRGGRCAGAVLDVTQAEVLHLGIAGLEKTLGPIDLLIASAGVGIETSALSYSAVDMNTVISINLLGVSNSIAAVLPGMLERRRGHIAAISSMASFRGMPRMLGYCASKAGVNAMMEGMRVEVENKGVFTTTICPGWIRTQMTEGITGYVPRMLEADDAAQRIIEAIHQKRRFFAFPASELWRLRMVNLLPRFLRDGLLRKWMKVMKRKT